MIKFYKFKPCFNLTDPSPFCVKVETFLKMAELPYEPITINDPRKGPKGKLPYIEDDTQIIADSFLILEYLIQKYCPDRDQTLSPAQSALGYHINKTLEEHYYWVIAHNRWIDNNSWPAIREEFFGSIPKLLRPIISELIKKKVKRNLYGHGMGHHTQEEIYHMGRCDLQAVSDSLGDNDFILGSHPSRFDCSVYAFVSNTLQCSLESPMQDFALTLPNLVAYNKRMKEKYYR
jgi:glutathione S-transferase